MSGNFNTKFRPAYSRFLLCRRLVSRFFALELWNVSGIVRIYFVFFLFLFALLGSSAFPSALWLLMKRTHQGKCLGRFSLHTNLVHTDSDSYAMHFERSNCSTKCGCLSKLISHGWWSKLDGFNPSDSLCICLIAVDTGGVQNAFEQVTKITQLQSEAGAAGAAQDCLEPICCFEYFLWLSFPRVFQFPSASQKSEILSRVRFLVSYEFNVMFLPSSFL